MRYIIVIQPLKTLSGYGPSEDVSDDLTEESLGSLEASLDGFEFQVGSFVLSSVNFVLNNVGGKYNNGGDFFTLKRDQAKVDITFLDNDLNEIHIFSGLISDEGSSGEQNNMFINVLVVSQNQILRQTIVDSGDITNGDTFKVAIESILNKTVITNVLNFVAGSIVPNLNLTIDDVSGFTDIPTLDVLNLLLLASNSIFYIDTNNTMIVNSRTVTDNKSTFFGLDDPFGRENILTISSITTGYQKLNNVISINGATVTDATSITNNGQRRKEISLDFITTPSNEISIAASYLAEFKDLKREVSLVVAVNNLTSENLLDEVELVLTDSTYNNIDIQRTDRFKITTIITNLANRTTDLKIREI